MTTSASHPSDIGEVNALRRRVTDLERALRDREQRERPDTVFVLSGPLYATTSPIYPCPQRRSYWQAACRLSAASSTTVEVEIAVDATLALTITFSAGVTKLLLPIDLTVARDAGITAEITDPGVGAEDLTIALRS